MKKGSDVKTSVNDFWWFHKLMKGKFLDHKVDMGENPKNPLKIFQREIVFRP